MRIAVARESDTGEPRVAATPETVKKFKALGADVMVARGAGIASGVPDAEFEAAGATVGENVTKDADVVLKVRRWSSLSWTLTATKPRSSRWPMPGSLPLPWN
jgi:H+-translocating NAD(P) transhydrogenase subunit alpha